MQEFKKAVQVCLTYAAVVILASGYPLTAFAETAAVDTAPPSEQAIVEPTPKPETTYTFNPETKHWDSNKWVYSATTGRYEAVPEPTVSIPPIVVESDMVQSPSESDDGATTTIDTTTQVTIDNNINSDATTGDATVDSNTLAKNATTGDASAVATLMNTINSSVSVSGAEFATFVADITGDVHGDIMLYPMLLKAMLQAAAQPSDTTIAVKTDAQITNDVNLNATSGDAAVTNNTSAGNATTGTANTVANVMNIINSIIAANESFVGTINIFGNLDGDILVAPDFLPQLLASNTGGSSAPAGSLTVSSQDTQSILNNINLNAASGDATVASNTSAGNATTGSASTNVVLLNLSGHQIVASDSLLVFVNVLGQWVGLIVDAPSGTNAAALGNGVVTNNVTPDLTIAADNDSRIINNINLDSQTGDATVAGNTTAGNATTGNATASANIANVSGSQFGLTGWFGVLFINVFGSWFGSFGVDTERGNQPQTNGEGGAQQPAVTSPTPSNQPFQFIPDDVKTTVAQSTPFFNESTGSDDVLPPVAEETETNDNGDVLAATTTPPSSRITSSQAQEQIDFLPFVTSAFILGLGGIAAKNIITAIRGRGRPISLLHR